MRRGRLLGCVTALGCLVLASCSTGYAGSGPLRDGEGQGTLCGPVPSGQVLSDGFDALRNSGQTPVTIKAVSLADPHNLRLIGAYVIPVAGSTLYGLRAGYPPVGGLDPGVAWSKRHLAAGATVPHSDASHVANLVLVVKPTAATGTAAGTRIDYRVGGQSYQFQTQIKLVVVVGKQCPSS